MTITSRDRDAIAVGMLLGYFFRFLVMLAIIVAAVVLTVQSCGCAVPEPVISSPGFNLDPQRAASCTVQVIRGPLLPGMTSGASGVAVLNRAGRRLHVLTAAHVVAESAVYSVRFEGGKLMEATVMRQEASSDLALIVGPVMSKDGCEATLGPPAARGDVVWTTGWPPDEELQVTTGHIRAILVMHGNRNYLASPDTGPGWSGGPLWNHRGALIGVVRAGYALATPFGTVYKASRTLYVHTSYLSDFLSGERTKDGGIIE